MPEHSDLGNRMKAYESAYTNDRLMPGLPAIARLDGRSFHSFTKGLERPYDARLSNLMLVCAICMAKETNALMVYTQSDEITLIWMPEIGSQMLFDGKIFKLQSILAAQLSIYFYKGLESYLPEKVGKMPLFDCRVFNVPNRTEETNCLLWRELDATRNSISMAAQAVFSHKELMNKGQAAMQEMLWQRGINWNDYPDYFKRGVYVQRRRTLRPFTAEEIESLPPKHAARTNPNLEVERKDYYAVEMPPITRVTNRVAVIFEGAIPQSCSSN
jgi:tRNA(His) 5'-end guanylyltransferase